MLREDVAWKPASGVNRRLRSTVVGIVAIVLVILAFVEGFAVTRNLAWNAVIVAFTIYVDVIALYVWQMKPYHKVTTGNDVFAMLAWPRSVVSATRKRVDKSAAVGHPTWMQRHLNKPIRRGLVSTMCIEIFVIAAVITYVGIKALAVVYIDVFLLGVLIYILGVIAYFLFLHGWKFGLARGLTEALFWPKKVRDKKRKVTQAP